MCDPQEKVERLVNCRLRLKKAVPFAAEKLLKSTMIPDPFNVLPSECGAGVAPDEQKCERVLAVAVKRDHRVQLS